MVAAVVAVLALLPAAVGALPAGRSDVPAERLRALVRGSGTVAWSGTGESRAGLALPDVRDLGDLPALLGSTVRTRTWWRGPTTWRVDEQRLAGEHDVVADGSGPGGSTTTWDSADRTVARVDGVLPVRLPRAADLVAPVLGRRLAGSPDTVAARLPTRRVAGVSAPGLRLVPREPASSTVSTVDLWADPGTGLVLQVQVRAVGQDRPVLDSLLLDLDRRVPPAKRTALVVPPDADVSIDQAPDVAAQIDAAVPYVLPGSLAGALRADVGGLEQARGVATYGTGLSSFVVVPLPGDVAGRLMRRLAGATGGTGPTARLSTPLLSGLVATAPRRAYLLVGSVPPDVLDRAFAQLQRRPPPRVRR